MIKYFSERDNMQVDGQPYVGYYCYAPDGNIYTGKQFTFGISKLIVNKKDIDDQEQIIVNQFIKHYPKPSKSNYNNGYITRYFVIHITNFKIIQIAPHQYHDNILFYNKLKLK